MLWLRMSHFLGVLKVWCYMYLSINFISFTYGKIGLKYWDSMTRLTSIPLLLYVPGVSGFLIKILYKSGHGNAIDSQYLQSQQKTFYSTLNIDFTKIADNLAFYLQVTR